ncbi:M28 family metallopeptidase [Christiangramia aquimixticola]|uniref:M28 family metallopeptidase n=1 Tax=Christiangramia aquimixticola TaxID=1697558 RepID=UPI003AA96464
MKRILALAIPALLAACSAQNNKIENADPMDYAKTITAEELKEHLYTFASDEFEGRETGEPGQKKAAEYLKNEYKSLNLPSPLGGDDYYQEVPVEYFKRGIVKPTENVVAFLKGSEKPDEILVISSHYDHVGMDDAGNIYNGADDDGSGTVSILEIAEAFVKASKDGFTPKRSILFLNVTGEEKGLVGSKFYTDEPIFPLANTVANLNIDMIGRIDPAHEGNNNYVYLIGSDKLSTELHELSETVNNKFMNLELDYKYNDENDPNRFYFRSDHYNFAKNNIPIIFYFNGTHADYHKPTDTPDKIEYDLLAKRAQLVFLTAWEIANRENRVVVDKPIEESAKK